MPMILVNPLDETLRARERAAPRLVTLAGATVALLDISKPGGSRFLDHLEKRLLEKHQVARVLRETKPTYSKPAPAATIERLRAVTPDAVIEALAD